MVCCTVIRAEQPATTRLCRSRAKPQHSFGSDRLIGYPSPNSFFPQADFAEVQPLAYAGACFAQDAQLFACSNNFFKFFFIMYLTATNEVATLAGTPQLSEFWAPTATFSQENRKKQ
jgi:hypothetical protein